MLDDVRNFYELHRSKYEELSQEAIKVGKADDAKELFRLLCSHLLGSGVSWGKATDTVKYLDEIGVLWQGEQSHIEKALRNRSYGTRYFGPKRASDFIYQNRQSLYDSGSIVALVKLLGMLSEKDPILARNVLAGHNKEMEIRLMGTDIRLKNFYIKGLGMKWASHFLRELGFSRNELAILDSHIVEYLVQFGVIAWASKSLPAETYLNIEEKMKEWARKEIPDIRLDHLDWVLWDMASGTGCR